MRQPSAAVPFNIDESLYNSHVQRLVSTNDLLSHYTLVMFMNGAVRTESDHRRSLSMSRFCKVENRESAVFLWLVFLFRVMAARRSASL